MTTTYYLRGPISSREQVIIVGIDAENNPYFLYSQANSSSLYFDPIRNYKKSPIQPIVFTVFKGSTRGTVYFTNNNINFLSQNKGIAILFNPTLPIIEQPSEYTLVPQDYSPTTSVLETGAFYILKNISFDTLAFEIFNKNDSTDPDITQIRFLPLKWYVNGNCENIVTSVSNVADQEYNWVTNPVNFSMQGFTTKNQCDHGLFYRYCNLDETCGDCFGLCPGNSTCREVNNIYTGGTPFLCKNEIAVNVNENLNETIFISIVVILLLILIIFILYVWSL